MKIYMHIYKVQLKKNCMDSIFWTFTTTLKSTEKSYLMYFVHVALFKTYLNWHIFPGCFKQCLLLNLSTIHIQGYTKQFSHISLYEQQLMKVCVQLRKAFLKMKKCILAYLSMSVYRPNSGMLKLNKVQSTLSFVKGNCWKKNNCTIHFLTLKNLNMLSIIYKIWNSYTRTCEIFIYFLPFGWTFIRKRMICFGNYWLNFFFTQSTSKVFFYISPNVPRNVL